MDRLKNPFATSESTDKKTNEDMPANSNDDFIAFR